MCQFPNFNGDPLHLLTMYQIDTIIKCHELTWNYYMLEGPLSIQFWNGIEWEPVYE